MSTSLPIIDGAHPPAPYALRRDGSRHRRPSVPILALTLILASCATYQPAPLSDAPDLSSELPHVTVPPAQLRLPGVASYKADTAQGLSMTMAAIVAVINNPKLRADRAKTGDARAQLFAAGLLPDPQLSLSGDHPTSGAAIANAFSAGLSYVLDQIITRHARLDSAAAQLRSVDLDILWQEWQVAQQARLSFAQVQSLDRQHKVLERYRALYDKIYRKSATALKEGNTTIDVTGTNLVALLDVDARLAKVGQDLDKAQHQLKAVLGLSPTIELRLNGSGPMAPPDDAAFRSALTHLAGRRPDLLALKAGYESQEAKLRQAILAQFPSLSVGINRARDTSAVYTTGLTVTVGLPFFSGNRGNIAIEKATRARLRAEYQARIDEAYGQADQLRDAYLLLARQRARVARQLPLLKQMADEARRAYAAHDLAAATYLTLEQAYLNKQLDAITLDQSLMEARITLQTVLGEPVASRPDSHGAKNITK